MLSSGALAVLISLQCSLPIQLIPPIPSYPPFIGAACAMTRVLENENKAKLTRTSWLFYHCCRRALHMLCTPTALFLFSPAMARPNLVSASLLVMNTMSNVRVIGHSSCKCCIAKNLAGFSSASQRSCFFARCHQQLSSTVDVGSRQGKVQVGTRACGIPSMHCFVPCCNIPGQHKLGVMIYLGVITGFRCHLFSQVLPTSLFASARQLHCIDQFTFLGV
jgi:hypothetical protein